MFKLDWISSRTPHAGQGRVTRGMALRPAGKPATQFLRKQNGPLSFHVLCMIFCKQTCDCVVSTVQTTENMKQGLMKNAAKLSSPQVSISTRTLASETPQLEIRPPGCNPPRMEFFNFWIHIFHHVEGYRVCWNHHAQRPSNQSGVDSFLTEFAVYNDRGNRRKQKNSKYCFGDKHHQHLKKLFALSCFVGIYYRALNYIWKLNVLCLIAV